MQESYFVICFNLDHRRYAIDQGRIIQTAALRQQLILSKKSLLQIFDDVIANQENPV